MTVSVSSELEVVEARGEGGAPEQAGDRDPAGAVVVVAGRLRAGHGVLDLAAAAGEDDVRRVSAAERSPK